jgi:Fuc2NAc and GlcNAc transferase
VRLETVWGLVTVLLGSALLTFAARKVALARDLVDVPNARSSHQTSTPRGGGVAIALVTSTSLLVLALRGSLANDLLVALAGGGLAVAMIGYADDRRPLPSGVRLIVHIGAAIWAVAWLGGLPPLRLGDHVTHVGWFGNIVAVIGIVWVLNLFNFMDGIDGIAASEAVFVALAGAWLTAGAHGSADVAAVSLAFAAACGGFLLWNWPPARIFMGDVGSGYLGYVIAVLALAATRSNPAALWAWLILGGVFFVDATVTLLRRLARREPVHKAHRSHAYQWLARRWGSHAKVTCAVLAVNVLWLLPCAAFAMHAPGHAVASAIVALAPLLLVAGGASGRREAQQVPPQR